MRNTWKYSALLGLLVWFPYTARAEDAGTKTSIEQKLTSQYAVTKITDDKTEIVTAGSILVLQKDKLVMVTADAPANHCPNTYKDGKLSQAGACKAGDVLKVKKLCPFCPSIPGEDKVPNPRAFVTGEKFWVTKIEVKDAGKDSGVVLEFFSDPIKDIRYKGVLTVPFKKGLPSPDEALKLVAEVLTVAPSEDAKDDSKDKGAPAGGAGASGKAAAAAAPDNAPAQAAAAEAPPPAIEAPPPPPPEPATVEIGQTADQVEAAWGQPTTKAKVGTKEIYFYKDKNLKVTFVNGKVKDVQ